MKNVSLVVTIVVLFVACAYQFGENKMMAQELQAQGKNIAKLERDRDSTWALLGIKQLDNGCGNLYMPVTE